ncbi:ABC transporter permease [Azospirillum sp. TSO22-1]|uniref:ABC transporter permease n=1 Tax=Azospirillum sp. TSO22-1 TaxID=716789 RepID=UPI000D641E35|nr:ABC transporter permease [Azospirillum sp. TSO22-1]
MTAAGDILEVRAAPRLPRLNLGRAGRWAFAAAAPVLLLAVWQALYALGVVRPILLPPPTRIAATLWSLIASGELPRHVGVSALRVLEGFALSASLALALGVAIGLSRTLDRFLDLLIQLVKPIPPIAWIPLAILWFGIGEEAKVYIIVVGGFFPILINTIDGIRQTDTRFVELAKLLEVPRWKFIRQVVLPGALPPIMSGLRIGLNVSWMCVVAAELIAASSGIGYLIMDARQLSQTDVVLAGMATMGVLGKLTDDALRLVERRLITWRTSFGGV